MVGDPALGVRQGAARDGHDQQARTFLGQGPHAFNPQREDGGEHDGVEQANQDQRIHGGMAAAVTSAWASWC